MMCGGSNQLDQRHETPRISTPIPGNYSVSLQAYNIDGFNSMQKAGYIDVKEGVAATAISFGESVSGTISVIGQTENYTFEANAGDSIYSRMSSSWSSGPQIRLYAPNGTQIAVSTSSLTSTATDLTLQLPSTRTYTAISRG